MIAFDLFPPAPPRVALLGCGTVGTAVARALVDSAAPAVLTKVLVRDASRDRGVPRELLTDSFDDVLDSRPEVIIEAIGGHDDALRYVSRALDRGISIVTANKTLIAHHGPALSRLAAQRGVSLRYEAAVCAAIPILAALDHLRGDRVTSITAIVSGTCNFILSAMSRGATFDKALAEAQRLGYAEPDPSADISGRDAAEKACLLASAIGLPPVTPDRVATEGIAHITSEDVAYARRTGHVIKLLAEIRAGGETRVGPALVAANHPLARVNGAGNALLIHAQLAGELLLQGPGAGPGPTASAILGDLARCLGREHDRPVHSPAVRMAVNEHERRRHAVRFSRGERGPESVLRAVRAHGLEADDVEFSRGEARVLVAASEVDRVAALESAFGSEVRIMPVYELASSASGSR